MPELLGFRVSFLIINFNWVRKIRPLSSGVREVKDKVYGFNRLIFFLEFYLQPELFPDVRGGNCNPSFVIIFIISQ
jgi:hypothetical protein